ncbi:zinc finger BED domain-containing protein 1-like [Rhizophagus clarus]|uniref:Zinc finger BED domain-containing protein 1-like n=1 Tax=Rhizophagus clarus TaxID=94130 RepID=A0A8H3M1M2_9GLOM|nr:zinc finger BED domain-containing protein 1-like [Rhizophagus clarus]
MHRNEMILDDDNTNQQELDNEGNEDDEHQSNRTPSDVWEYIDKVIDPENPKCRYSITTDIWSSIKNEAIIGVTIHFIINEWKLKHFTLEVLQINVISITTDNGSNMIVACRLLKNDFDAQTLALDFIHSRCICYILNLAVNAGLKFIENLIKLRKIVKSIRRTQLYLEELERLAIAANHTFKHPILDIKTRWNSTFLMAEQSWEKIEHLVILLSQFHIATTKLSTQTYPTIAYTRVVLLEYWVHIDKMTHVLAFFDPRYKTIAYKNLEINEILEPIRNNFPDSALSNLPSNNSTSIFVQSLSSVRQQRNANTDELLKYWESADASFDIEPLSWWHAHSTEYPILSKIAQNYLSVQAFSVP